MLRLSALMKTPDRFRSECKQIVRLWDRAINGSSFAPTATLVLALTAHRLDVIFIPPLRMELT